MYPLLFCGTLVADRLNVTTKITLAVYISSHGGALFFELLTQSLGKKQQRKKCKIKLNSASDHIAVLTFSSGISRKCSTISDFKQRLQQRQRERHNTMGFMGKRNRPVLSLGNLVHFVTVLC